MVYQLTEEEKAHIERKMSLFIQEYMIFRDKIGHLRFNTHKDTISLFTAYIMYRE
jgi:hypothetical protein